MSALQIRRLILLSFLAFGSLASKAQGKKFAWIPWAKVSPEIKSALKKMKSYNGQTVYQEIVSQLKFGGTASLAVVDLDGDGVPGYAVGHGGSINCGSLGCSFTVFEKGGKMRIDLTDTWQEIKPAKGGVISSAGKFFALEAVK